MKKLLIIGLVAMAAFSASAQSVRPVSFFRVPGTYVSLSNNYTLLYGSTTNITWVPYANGTNVVGGATLLFTNAGSPGIAATTQTLQFPYILGEVDVIPNLNGNVNDNCSISVTWGVVTNYSPGIAPFPQGQRTWPVINGYTNAAGQPAIPVGLFPASITATNTCNVVIQRSGDGVNYGTQDQDKFVFTFGVTALNIVAGGANTVITNVPTTFLVGAKKLRCLAITNSSTTSSVGITLNALTFNPGGPTVNP